MGCNGALPSGFMEIPALKVPVFCIENHERKWDIRSIATFDYQR